MDARFFTLFDLLGRKLIAACNVALLAVLAILVSESPAAAAPRCLDTAVNKGLVAMIRQSVANHCPCATDDASRVVYQTCARDILRRASDEGILPRECRSTARKAALKSSCARPARTTCCRNSTGSCLITTGTCASRDATPASNKSCHDGCSTVPICDPDQYSEVLVDQKRDIAVTRWTASGRVLDPQDKVFERWLISQIPFELGCRMEPFTAETVSGGSPLPTPTERPEVAGCSASYPDTYEEDVEYCGQGTGNWFDVNCTDCLNRVCSQHDRCNQDECIGANCQFSSTGCGLCYFDRGQQCYEQKEQQCDSLSPAAPECQQALCVRNVRSVARKIGLLSDPNTHCEENPTLCEEPCTTECLCDPGLTVGECATPIHTSTFTHTATRTRTRTPSRTPTWTATWTHTGTATRTPSRTPTRVDFGDNPDPYYKSSLSVDGPRHALGSGVYLGACVDGEPDAFDGNGQGDDLAIGTQTFGACAVPGDDEDGIQFGPLVQFESATITVKANQQCRLNAWIDFNQDGYFPTPGGDGRGREQVITDELVSNTETVDIYVPPFAAIGDTYARFRCSSTLSVGPTGFAGDGEVEDYRVTIQARSCTPPATPSPTPPLPTPTPVDYQCRSKILSDQPLAYYKVDEASGSTALDSSGNNRNGTFAPGIILGRGPLITGGGTSIQTTVDDGFTASLSAALLGSYTIEAWVIPGLGRAIVHMGGASSTYSYQLRLNSSMKFEHYAHDGQPRVVTGTTTAEIGKTYHVVGTGQNGGKIRLFVNGREEGTPVAIATNWTGGSQLRVGLATVDHASWSGRIDEVAVYGAALDPITIRGIL